MNVATTIQQARHYVKQARSKGSTIGLVPTMGALHQGHSSLIEEAKKRCVFVAVSIFVNPSQFGPGEDFQNYPRTAEQDLRLCRRLGVDMVFMPEPDQMYPQKQLTWVDVQCLSQVLCGQSRPGHFRGVTTVCAKLFNIITCDYAFFGQKDAQQSIIIRKMVQDLNMPLEIVICPTIRLPNGLAVSSRNKYLTDQQRSDAAVIYQSLQQAQNLVVREKITDAEQIRSQMRQTLTRCPGLAIEYIEITDAQTLEPLTKIDRRTLIAIAAKLGKARLIDNIIIDPA